MKLISTRSNGSASVSFRKALLNGLAPDGGLYVPDLNAIRAHPPAVNADETFPKQAGQLLAHLLRHEFSESEIRGITEEAFTFPVPLTPLGNRTFLLELFHGPTQSFKDFGARFMARAMRLTLEKRQEKICILVATSGDTGSAVADGFAGQENIRVVLLYPNGKVSPIQEKQLITPRKGVLPLCIEGNFDDCQRLVKSAFTHFSSKTWSLSSANSINIGRLLPQMTYYWHAFSKSELKDAVLCVPSGNLGNITAGFMAALMGSPIRHFTAGHNSNDAFPRFLQNGSYEARPTRFTISNAMDVGNPSNFERLSHWLSLDEMRQHFSGFSIDEASTRKQIKRAYENHGLLICPHTAVGLEAAERFRAESAYDGAILIAATAHPAKFPDIVQQETGVFPSHKALDTLVQAPSAVKTMLPDEANFAHILTDLLGD